MDPKAKALRIGGIVLLIISAVVMLYYAYALPVGGMSRLMPVMRCILNVCLPLIVGTVFVVYSLPERAQKARAVRTVVWVLFAFYLLALFSTLFLARIDFADYAANRAYYRENYDLMTNFRPFETIRLYIRCLVYDIIGVSTPLANLMGNVLLFMPMAAFLPILFVSMRKFWKFLLLMTAVLVAVEALQLLLCCGSCDIDDVILNLFGTLLVYGLLRIPFIKRLMVKWYLMKEPEAAPFATPAGL